MQILNNIIQQFLISNNTIITKFRQNRKNMSIQITINPIDRRSLDAVYNMMRVPQFAEERKKYPNQDDVDVIIDSFGGDADAAYHIAKMLHSNFKGKINYIVPRFAKSAATLMVCGGDKIIMGETSELGPLDPQIRQDDGRYVSAKSVQKTLDLIKEQIKDGDKHSLEFAAVLSSKINPLVLGEYNSAMEISKEYQTELLLLRMFKGKNTADVDKIVKKFSVGYTHHSRVIGCNEAKEIFGENNIEIMGINDPNWQLIWQFYETNRNISDLVGVLNLLKNNRK